MTQTHPDPSSHRTLLAVVLIVIAAVSTGCDTRTSLKPLEDEHRGLTALSWGMHPDSAKVHMLKMEGLSLSWDSVYISDSPAYRTPDSVEVSGMPVRRRRLQIYEGGEFLGLPVQEWHLQFERPNYLREVTVVVTTKEHPVQVFRQMRLSMRTLYGDPIVTDESSSGFIADGWKRGDEGTATTNVRIWHWRSGSREKSNRFVTVFSDKAYDDSVRNVYGNAPRRTMHVDEWEKLKKKLLEDIEKGD